MAGDEGLEGGLVAVGGVAGQELAVAEPDGGAVVEQVAEVPQGAPHYADGHGYIPPPVPSVPPVRSGPRRAGPPLLFDPVQDKSGRSVRASRLFRKMSGDPRRGLGWREGIHKGIVAVTMARRKRSRGVAGRGQAGSNGRPRPIMTARGRRRSTATSSPAWPSSSPTPTPRSTGLAATRCSTRSSSPSSGRRARPTLRGQAGQGLAQDRRGEVAADPRRGPGLEGGRLPRADARLQPPDLRPL